MADVTIQVPPATAHASAPAPTLLITPAVGTVVAFVPQSWSVQPAGPDPEYHLQHPQHDFVAAGVIIGVVGLGVWAWWVSRPQFTVLLKPDEPADPPG